MSNLFLRVSNLAVKYFNRYLDWLPEAELSEVSPYLKSEFDTSGDKTLFSCTVDILQVGN